MAPIPPVFIQIATVFLTQMLTRRLQQSPLFFRAVDRMLHEIDHLPHRMQGRAVPYRPINSQEPTLTERAQDAWNNEDHGEPHDLPNPFADPKLQQSIASPSTSSSSTPPGQMSRDKARQSIEAAQRNAQQARQRRKEQDKEAKRDAKMDEMRSVLERLRDARQQEQRQQ